MAESTEAAPTEAPASPAGRRRALKHIGALTTFSLYVAFVVGAIYFIPQVLSWALDTPHPMAAVSSQSMWPSLKKGDLIFIEGVDSVEELRVGDIIAFQHPKGITVHRVIQIEGDQITTKGDANPVKDRPIDFTQIVGRVLTIGGHVARVPYLGSLPGLFGSLATQPTATQHEDDPSETTMGRSGAVPNWHSSPVDSPPGTIELASVDSGGNQANGLSTYPALSGDGRLVAFASSADNLTPGDVNQQSDIFVHDRHTGMTERISVDSDGLEANGGSTAPAISGDGRIVAFVSSASNLVPGDTNAEDDVFVRDRNTGMTERISVDRDGLEANGGGIAPAISGDGRFVAFVSGASNLIPDDTNAVEDVFVHDRRTGMTQRISVDSNGLEANGRSIAPAISKDGRFVAFVSKAGNLVSGDSNRKDDVFVHDRKTGMTERISVDSDGLEAKGDSEAPAISEDGRFVAFVSEARNLVSDDLNRKKDVFVRDRKAGTTELASVNSLGNQASSGGDAPAISGDGRFIAFQAGASNLVRADNNRFQDVFVHDREGNATYQVSVSGAGEQGNDHSGKPMLSADGRAVAFWSWATNLVPTATKVQIIVVHDQDAAAVTSITASHTAITDALRFVSPSDSR